MSISGHLIPSVLRHLSSAVCDPWSPLRCQPFRLERFLHLWPGADAIDVGLEVGPLGEINADARGPAQHGIEISVRHAELIAHQVLLARELLVEPIKPLAEILFRDLLVRIGGGRPEDRPKALVQLRGDEIEPFLDAVALGFAGGRDEIRAGVLIGDPLHDHRALGEPLAVVEFENRDLALGVDGPVVDPGLGLLLLIVHLLEIVLCTRLAHHDVGRERAGAWGIVKLHSILLPTAGRAGGREVAWTCRPAQGGAGEWRIREAALHSLVLLLATRYSLFAYGDAHERGRFQRQYQEIPQNPWGDRAARN